MQVVLLEKKKRKQARSSLNSLKYNPMVKYWSASTFLLLIGRTKYKGVFAISSNLKGSITLILTFK
jgi:hypothetical protein